MDPLSRENNENWEILPEIKKLDAISNFSSEKIDI